MIAQTEFELGPNGAKLADSSGKFTAEIAETAETAEKVTGDESEKSEEARGRESKTAAKRCESMQRLELAYAFGCFSLRLLRALRLIILYFCMSTLRLLIKLRHA
jgi:hypothetical protein